MQHNYVCPTQMQYLQFGDETLENILKIKKRIFNARLTTIKAASVAQAVRAFAGWVFEFQPLQT